MRVLYLTYDGLTDPLGQSQILPYLFGLKERLGERLQPDILSFEKEERHRQYGEDLQRELMRRGIGWYPQRFHRQPPILAKAYDQWRFFQVAWKKVQQVSYAVYHARSYVAGWIAHRISQRTGRPWIFDMRGFWADERRDNGVWPAENPAYHYLYRLWKERERIMLNSATEIVVLSEAAIEKLEKWGISSQKVSVIPCAANFDAYRMSAQERLRTRQNLREGLNIPSNATILVYSGSIAPHYAPEDIAAVFKAAHSQQKEIYLLILTPHDTSAFEAMLKAWGLPTHQYKALSIPHARVPAYLTAADAGIATVKPTFSKVASSFTKLAEYLAADLPVIATAIGDVEALAQQIPGIFPYRHSSEIPSIVQKLLHFLKEESPKLKAPLSNLSRPILGLEMALDRYQAIYERLLEKISQNPKPIPKS